MKDFFEYISKQGSAFSGFTCKEPLNYENESWKCLEKMDCTARNVEETADKRTSVLPRRSIYSTSAVTDVTEETATNIHMPTPTTSAGMSVVMWGLGIIMIISILINVILLVACMRKRRRPHEPTRENTGALLSGNDEERVQESEL
jgi:hypothetical protein